MRTIRISEEVWAAIASEGKFGETPDDVLRRLLKIAPSADGNGDSGTRQSRATQRMHADIRGNQFEVSFQGGQRGRWTLPNRSDKAAIRKVLDQAIEFARANDATLGQINAVRKALTDHGYHLTK